MRQPFLTLLQLQRTREQLSMQDLADRLGLKSHSYVAEVLSGKKTLPLGDVETWAKALKFDAPSLIELYDAAIADLAPAWLGRQMDLRRARIEELSNELAKLRQAVLDRWMRGDQAV